MSSSAVRRRRGGLAVAVAMLVQAVVLGISQHSASAIAQLPFVVTNNSGRADATFIYVMARNGTTSQPGYVDASGTWRAFVFPASTPNGPVAAPDVSIAGPATGTSKTISLPPNLSGGRIYLSFGTRLNFYLTTNGLVEPAPWNAGDTNRNILYDWTEFARSGERIFINTTGVDMYAMSMSVSVTTNGATQTEGSTASRQSVLDALNALGSTWTPLVQTAPDGSVVRLLAPIHGIANGVFSSTYLDSYIAAVWSYFTTHTLTVDTAWGAFTGTVSGTTMTVRNTTGGTVGTLARPTTRDAFGCEGALQPTAGQPDVPGILAFGARVCAGFHRATLSTSTRVMFDHQPTTDASQFYGQSASDLYSKVLHQNGIGGRAYGFAYDDVGPFAPVIDSATPSSAGMTVQPFAGTTPPPPPPPTGQQIKGPGGKCVDVAGANTGGNGAAVQLWDCEGTGSTDQYWSWSGQTLRTLGRCLDVSGGSTANGALLQLYDCNGSGAQNWVQEASRLRNPASNRCMDSPNGATANGTRLTIYDCNGSAAQSFVVGGGTPPPAGATQINAPGGKCVDVAGNNTGVNGAAVQLWTCLGTSATDQQWTWNGTSLRTLGRCLDVTGGSTANLAQLQLWDCNGGGAQQWQQVGNTLRNPASGRCIDSPGGATADGTRLQIYDCNGSGAQYFVKAA